MKYTILGFQQTVLIELGLTIEHAAIIRHFADFCNTDEMVKIMFDNKFYYWVKYDGVIEDLPILNKKKDTIYRMLKYMSEKGIFERYTLKNGGTFSYYRLNSKVFKRLISGPEERKESVPSDENPDPSGQESVGVTDQNPEGYGSESGTNNSSTKDSSTKDNPSTKDPQEEGQEISSYSAQFMKAMISFKEMRDEIKTPLSTKAEKMILTALTKICGDVEKHKIDVLEQSIINQWKGVFPIRGPNNAKKFGAKEITTEDQERMMACELN